MDEKLKEIEARREKATPGPMDYSGYCMIDGAIHVGTIGPKGKTGINFTDETSCDRLVLDVSCRGEDDKQAISDADFYAHAQVDTRYLLTALRESEEREKSQQRASEINHEEYQDLCGQFALPKACGCNKNGNDQWCALAPFHEIKRLREREKKLVEAQRWIPVSERLPECDTTPNSFGVPVLVWPPFKSDGCSDMTQAFYGCRQTDEPNFYIFGRVFDPEYWMPLPAPPAKEESHD